MEQPKTAEVLRVPNYSLGYLYALGAVVAGIIVWVLVWKMGFIASIVAFGMAAGVSYLYQLGAKANIDKKSGIILIIMIIVGLLLAFGAGMVSDAWDVYSSIVPGSSLFDSGFINFVTSAISQGGVIAAYGKDFAMAALFGALGSFGIIKDLINASKQPVKPAVK